jgi:hypothetical protein
MKYSRISRAESLPVSASKHRHSRSLENSTKLRSQVATPAPRRADDLMDKYMGMLLPDDFKQRFPSMRALYDEISADLHDAVGSSALFDSSIAKITEHFDARRLYSL